jgi:flagellar hook-associated protein 3 FlgL
MDFSIGQTQAYLAHLDTNQKRIQDAQTRISSGLRLTGVSDDPGVLDEIYETQSRLTQIQQAQSNLHTVQARLSVSDSSLQNAVSVVQSAITLSSQGISSTVTPTQMAAMATQAEGMLEQLVSLSQTSAAGAYVFSGDDPTAPQYQLDLTQPNGVKQLSASPSTEVTLDINGIPIASAQTAVQIFDAQNATGAPVAGNVFKAVNDLRLALLAGDHTAVQAANSELSDALDHLNGSLSLYGAAEDQIQSAVDLADKFKLSQEDELGKAQDADVAAEATVLSQTQTLQQAALSVAAKILEMPNLFKFLS